MDPAYPLAAAAIVLLAAVVRSAWPFKIDITIRHAKENPDERTDSN